LNKENLRNQPEQQTSGTTRSEKTSKRILLYKKAKFKSEKLHQTNPKEQIGFSTKNLHINLPEFIHFQSDHLVLTPKLTSHSFYDRLRNTSTFQTSKFNRQLIIPQTITTNPTVHSSTKRILRSRHSYDTVIYRERQQQKYPIRSMMNKFDSMSCFNEVRRLVIFYFLFSSCLFKQTTSMA
jgi:hypothetical protein